MADLTHIKYGEDISSLSDMQDKILALLPIVPSLLSAAGSGCIIHMVIASERKTPYRRIMLGLSCYDFVSSMVYPLQAFLLPRETSQHSWAIGTDATCSMMGFFNVVFASSIFYSGMLSLYFTLTVRFGVREKDFTKRYEPYMHAVAIGYPLVSGLVGLGLGTYHEVELGAACGTTNYPEGCGCKEGQDGECCISPILAWIFGGIPLFLIFLAIVIGNCMVFWHVRTTINRTRRYHTASITGHGSMSRSINQNQTRRGSPMGSSLRSRAARNRERDPQVERIRSVAIQAILYVAGFFFTQAAYVTLRIMESRNFDAEDEGALFPLLVIQALTLPSQGIINCLVYARPGFLRARKEYPNQSRFWAFRRALHGDKVQPSDDVSQNEDSTPKPSNATRSSVASRQISETQQQGENEAATSTQTKRGLGGLPMSHTEEKEMEAQTFHHDDYEEVDACESPTGEDAKLLDANRSECESSSFHNDGDDVASDTCDDGGDVEEGVCLPQHLDAGKNGASAEAAQDASCAEGGVKMNTEADGPSEDKGSDNSSEEGRSRRDIGKA